MREFIIDTKQAQTEEGQPLGLEYFITVDELAVGGTLVCESYGAAVSRAGGEDRVEVRNITTSATRIERMVALFAEHLVTPETLFDVVMDML